MMMNANLKRNMKALGWVFLILLFLVPSVAAAATLAIDDVSLNEGDGGTTNYVFTVTLTGNDAGGAFNLNYATSEGTATTGDNDFSSLSGTLPFAGTDGESAQITVFVNGDGKVEPGETFYVDLSTAGLPGTVTIADAQGLGTIINDDAATISVNDVTVAESGGNATFTVTMSAPVDVDVSVDTASADGTATSADGDFGAAVSPATITAGSTTVTFDVPVTADGKVELDETFLVNLSNISAGGRNVTFADAQGEGTITETDAATISVNDVTVAESGGNATFTVTMSAPVDVDVSVDTASADGTATSADGDFGAAVSPATITAGSTTVTFDVPVTADGKVELDETFLVNLSNISAGGRNVTFADAQGEGTITETDAATISVNDVTVAESGGNATFTVTMSAPVDVDVSVDTASADGTATSADGDFGAAVSPATITAGSTTVTFDVPVTADGKVELDETFLVNLSNISAGGRNVTFADAQGEGTITETDAATISVNDVTVAESGGNATFTVTMSAPVDVDVSVDTASADGTATSADGDFGAAVSPATITAGSTTVTFDVPVTADGKVELDETFLVNLSNISAGGRNVTFADAQGEGTITETDAATISVNDVTVAESGGNATFTVTMSAPVDVDVSVDTASADGTATSADGDFGAAVSPATITAGSTTVTFDVPVTADGKVELDETFLVNLSNISAGGRNVTFADAQGEGTITNDDTNAQITVTPSADITEGDSGTTAMVFSAQVDKPIDVDVTFAFAVDGGTTTVNGTDYTLGAPTTVTLPADSTTAVAFTVANINGDQTLEIGRDPRVHV